MGLRGFPGWDQRLRETHRGGGGGKEGRFELSRKGPSLIRGRSASKRNKRRAGERRVSYELSIELYEKDEPTCLDRLEGRGRREGRRAKGRGSLRSKMTSLSRYHRNWLFFEQARVQVSF